MADDPPKDAPQPGLIERAKTAIGGLLYDPDRNNPDSPHFDFSGGDNKVPRQIMVNGKLVNATPEETAKLVGNTTEQKGPNADEARDYLTNVRINAGRTGALPPVYERMAKARAAGFSWDEINQNMAMRRQKALEAGYSSDEINAHLLGVPIDSNPRAPDGAPQNLPDEVATPLRQFSDKWFGPHDPFATQRLPTPGAEYTAGGLLERWGWNALDFAKTFPGAVVNGAAATAEMFDGKDRNPYEWAKLGWEATGFWALFLPLKKGARPIPSPKEFLDAATNLAEKHPEGVTDRTLSIMMRELGEHYVNTGEHPGEAVGKPLVVEPQPVERPLKEGEGAKPADPVKSMASDMEAQDRIVAPERVKDPQPVKETTFEKLLADESGKINLTPRADIQPETLFQRNNDIGQGIVRDITAALSPNTLAPEAGAAIAAKLAKSAVETERSIGNVQRFGRAVGELSTAERFKLMDAIETGKMEPYKGTTLGALAKQIRAEFDNAYARMEKLGIAPGYVENYLPHIYQNPEAASDWLRKRPLAGNKAFTKERIFGSYAEAREAGLIPATDNPITLSAVAIRQMNRYIAAHEIVKDFREAGHIVPVPAGEIAPRDHVAINGRLGVTGEGNLYAPTDVARLINNITDPGLAQYSLYRVLRGAGNSLIQTQLGLSAYHATFISLDSVKSQVALAAQQFSSLRPLEMARSGVTLSKSIMAPVESFIRGRRVLSYLHDPNAPVSPEIRKLADYFIEGGGRTGLPEEYRGSAYGNFVNALKGTFVPSTGYATLGQEIADIFRNAQPVKAFGAPLAPAFVRGTFQLLGRTMDTLAAPIMSTYVPAMKAGVFSTLMRDALRLAPEMGELEVRHVANLINKSMDNRMGEMVYDNRFWNKTARDIAHLGIRALGWNVGDIAEIGGGLQDFAQMTYKGRQLKVGDNRMITYRASYVVGEAATTVMLGAITGYLAGTWSSDWSPIDYFFPPTKKDGNLGRIAFPTYAKDIYNVGHAISTASFRELGKIGADKLNPLWTAIPEALTNRDWNGAVIANPHDDILSEAGDYAKWFARQYMPISVQQMHKPTPDQAEIPWEWRALGINPAPWAVREPGKAEHFSQKELSDAIRKKARTDAKNAE